ncbi:MAG TPA: acyl-CoA dehydrogenase family protein [Hyphomicrobiaceae bacterium]|nr:acyl-CoA dehydrogenase family protein [Hyphomicrobiaceae bacterium]
MHFKLSDEQILVRDTLSRFLADRYDLSSRRRYLALADGFSRENWRDLAELGLLSLAFPAALGGMGGTLVDSMIVMEELGYHAAVEPFSATFAVGVALGFADDRNEAARLAERLTAGELIVSPALLEPRLSFDRPPKTSARPEAGGFRLSGTKRLVRYPAAELFLVSAAPVCASGSLGAAELFLVPANSEGLSRLSYRTIDGAPGCDLHLENATLPQSRRLVGADLGADALERVTMFLAFAGSAEMLGILRRLVETTRDYLKTRVQFGKPLATKQVVRHRIAEMYMHCDLARSAVIGAALRELGSAESRRAVAAAKVTVNAAADYIGKQAVQLHGGMGVSDEHEVSHAYKRLMVLKPQFGDTRTHARHLGAVA